MTNDEMTALLDTPTYTCEICESVSFVTGLTYNASGICQDCSDALPTMIDNECVNCTDTFQSENVEAACPTCMSELDADLWEESYPEEDYYADAMMAHWDDDPSPYFGNYSED